MAMASLAGHTPSYVGRIPRYIHQTYRSVVLPPHWEESRSEWKRLHPESAGWKYVFWLDEDLEELVATRYPELLAYYKFYPHVIQRVDAARYLILDAYGGVYSDLDLQATRPIDEFLETGSETYFALSTNVSSCLTNSLMASAPGAEVWQHVRRELARWSPPAWALTKHFAIMTSTGPMMLDRVFRRQASGNVAILPPALFSNRANQDAGQAAIRTIEGSSWCSFDSEVFIFINNNRALIITLGVVAIISIIVVAIALHSAWSASRNSLYACEASLAECSLGATTPPIQPADDAWLYELARPRSFSAQRSNRKTALTTKPPFTSKSPLTRGTVSKS